MVSIVDKDLFDTRCSVIVHQVNCLGVMGSGIARQIRERFPQHYVDYMRTCKSNKPPYALLGTAFVTVNAEAPYDIAGVFGQLSYGTCPRKRYTDYDALFKGLSEITKLYDSIAIPYLIGCGLGGGDQSRVLSGLKILAKERDCYIEICRK